MARNPYSRGEFTQALVLNALMHPFNVGLLAAVTVAAIVLGSTPLGVIGGLLYLGSAGRTFFDEKEADKVLERERAERKAIDKPQVQPAAAFAPPIARLVGEARVREQKVAEAIQRAALPHEEVASEVEAFVVAMDATARRAQLLYEALADTPPSECEKRLAAVRQGNLPETRELQAALEVQLETMRRMERQLQRFYMEMERLLVELDTVRGQVVSMSASADRASQDQLVADVRGLRERMGAVAEGMAEAYETEPRDRDVIDHVGYEVADLARSGRFYDAVFYALGVRRLHENAHVIGWGVTEPAFWLTTRSAPAPSYGHVALRAMGKAAVDAAHAAGVQAGGSDDGAPGPRPQYGPRYYAAYLRDPDGLRVEIVAHP